MLQRSTLSQTRQGERLLDVMSGPAARPIGGIDRRMRDGMNPA
ncbi:MAG: hypothetical protein ACOC26_05650 [Halochromatium sp.]